MIILENRPIQGFINLKRHQKAVKLYRTFGEGLRLNKEEKCTEITPVEITGKKIKLHIKSPDTGKLKITAAVESEEVINENESILTVRDRSQFKIGTAYVRVERRDQSSVIMWAFDDTGTTAIERPELDKKPTTNNHTQLNLASGGKVSINYGVGKDQTTSVTMSTNNMLTTNSPPGTPVLMSNGSSDKTAIPSMGMQGGQERRRFKLTSGKEVTIYFGDGKREVAMAITPAEGSANLDIKAPEDVTVSTQ